MVDLWVDWYRTTWQVWVCGGQDLGIGYGVYSSTTDDCCVCWGEQAVMQMGDWGWCWGYMVFNC